MGPLHFQPIYQTRPWGGRELERRLGRPLPDAAPYGESWEIVDRPEAQSVVRTGPLAGLSLRQVLERHGAEVLGPGRDPSRRFPILVKWLDCRERLSLQVHPPAAVAPSLGGEPKTETWYVAHAEPGAGLLCGLRRGADRAAFEAALRAGALDPLVHRVTVGAGDTMFTPSGRLHAIDAGCLILEIQQNSDTTYRVYDWGRVGLDGKPRQMHVRESLASIDFADFEPEPLRAAQVPQGGTVAACAEFRIRRWTGPASLELPAGDCRLVGVASGEVACSVHGGAAETWSAGVNVLLPHACGVTLGLAAGSAVLVTDSFLR